MSFDTGVTESSEQEHSHDCLMCGVWSHQDESCVGPRYDGKAMSFAGTYDCPMCEAGS